MKKPLTLFSCLLSTLFLLAGFALPDSEAPNERHRAYSGNKQFYVEMIPTGEEFGGSGPGKGVAYRADTREILWQVDWYARQVILCDDGTHLIRLGPWASDYEGLSDLAIAFYANGKELHKYLVKDLIRDRSRLQPTVSHYFWQDPSFPREKGLSGDGKKYTLILIDGTVHEFDVETGKILSTQTAV